MESRIESSADFVDYMIPLSSMGGGVKKQNANVNLSSQIDTPMGMNVNNSQMLIGSIPDFERQPEDMSPDHH
jgi:hypothetical protein